MRSPRRLIAGLAALAVAWSHGGSDPSWVGVRPPQGLLSEFALRAQAGLESPETTRTLTTALTGPSTTSLGTGLEEGALDYGRMMPLTPEAVSQLAPRDYLGVITPESGVPAYYQVRDWLGEPGPTARIQLGRVTSAGHPFGRWTDPLTLTATDLLTWSPRRLPPAATGLEEPSAPTAPAVTTVADAAEIARLQGFAVGAWRTEAVQAELSAGATRPAGPWLVFAAKQASWAPIAIARGVNVAVIAKDSDSAEAIRTFLGAVPNPDNVRILVGPYRALIHEVREWLPLPDFATFLWWFQLPSDPARWPSATAAIRHTDKFLAAIGA